MAILSWLIPKSTVSVSSPVVRSEVGSDRTPESLQVLKSGCGYQRETRKKRKFSPYERPPGLNYCVLLSLLDSKLGLVKVRTPNF